MKHTVELQIYHPGGDFFKDADGIGYTAAFASPSHLHLYKGAMHLVIHEISGGSLTRYLRPPRVLVEFRVSAPGELQRRDLEAYFLEARDDLIVLVVAKDPA